MFRLYRFFRRYRSWFLEGIDLKICCNSVQTTRKIDLNKQIFVYVYVSNVWNLSISQQKVMILMPLGNLAGSWDGQHNLKTQLFIDASIHSWSIHSSVYSFLGCYMIIYSVPCFVFTYNIQYIVYTIWIHWFIGAWFFVVVLCIRGIEVISYPPQSWWNHETMFCVLFWHVFVLGSLNKLLNIQKTIQNDFCNQRRLVMRIVFSQNLSTFDEICRLFTYILDAYEIIKILSL